MKITDLRCAKFGEDPPVPAFLGNTRLEPNLVLRICTDEGISGYAQLDNARPELKPHVLYYKKFIIGEDPTDVERVMQKIRRKGSFKPWGSSVSAIEMALWDIAGKSSGLPVYKLLGGKVRDRVRIYNGGIRFPMKGVSPRDYAESTRKMLERDEGFTIIKQPIGFHSDMVTEIPDFFYGEPGPGVHHNNRGLLTESGLNHIIGCVKAMKDVTGDKVGLALDCGPGFMTTDALRLAKALEPLNIMWLEDLITGDYMPYVMADVYRDITRSTTTPIHTGEQIYLRQNFRELIETHAVNIIGPDPLDVGGLAELKWIAEYADLHGIMIAPHGMIDGLFGLAGLIQVCATLPQNYIAFEYPAAVPGWWHDIINGLPSPIVRNGFIDVLDKPGLGIEFDIGPARKYLAPEDKDFFED
jgi:L-alanine-DL-glutamate epimerase-like enolase superfamily enzyme